MEEKEEKYEVIESFRDLKDDEYIYLKNVEGKNVYPREGLKPNKERIEELSSDKNQIGKPLIRKIEEKAKNKQEEKIKTEQKEKTSENSKENKSKE